MYKVIDPPLLIKGIPICQPVINCPSANTVPVVFLSNDSEEVVNLPMYLTPTFEQTSGTAPDPGATIL
jgi:hypothetical protein